MPFMDYYIVVSEIIHDTRDIILFGMSILLLFLVVTTDTFSWNLKVEELKYKTYEKLFSVS